MNKIKRALVSVSDKSGLVPFCQLLIDQGVSIISTGGTARFLESNGIPYENISDFTQFPEMLDGRVKTLHPKVHGGILHLRDNPSHVETIATHNIQPIDLLIINLYPFREVASNPDASFEEVIENIDIGGPSMVRSASKNYRFVGIVTAPSQYSDVMSELKTHGGALSESTKLKLATESFSLTARYDQAIYQYLSKHQQEESPRWLFVSAELKQSLRYGENPHQKASYYTCETKAQSVEPLLSESLQIQGKELSFNNLLDFEGALNCLKDFNLPCAVVVKHNNPCGIAIDQTIEGAFEKAWNADPLSAFGSVIAFNETVTTALAQKLKEYFIEGIIAPDISQQAREILGAKKNLRVLLNKKLSEWKTHFTFDADEMDHKKVSGGFLIQSRDHSHEDIKQLKTVTDIVVPESALDDLAFAWKVVKHIKSNAIVFAKKGVTTGIGAGQMSRVDALKMAMQKAGDALSGSVLASDAFFPFRDSIDNIVESDIKAIIQPGGSVRDAEVIAACNAYKIPMIFTGVRHFKH